VSAYRKTSPTWGPVFFTNYVHGAGLEELKEYEGRRLIHTCQLWQVAASSASTPPLFRPQSVGMNSFNQNKQNTKYKIQSQNEMICVDLIIRQRGRERGT
jgi:hypothetical protein